MTRTEFDELVANEFRKRYDRDELTPSENYLMKSVWKWSQQTTHATVERILDEIDMCLENKRTYRGRNSRH
jgi:hypothetical protein